MMLRFLRQEVLWLNIITNIGNDYFSQWIVTGAPHGTDTQVNTKSILWSTFMAENLFSLKYDQLL